MTTWYLPEVETEEKGTKKTKKFPPLSNHQVPLHSSLDHCAQYQVWGCLGVPARQYHKGTKEQIHWHFCGISILVFFSNTHATIYFFVSNKLFNFISYCFYFGKNTSHEIYSLETCLRAQTFMILLTTGTMLHSTFLELITFA